MHRLASLAFGCALLSSSLAAELKIAPLRYATRQERDRDGIGKFHLGREIAHVMAHRVADWLERPEREEEENIATQHVPVFRREPK